MSCRSVLREAALMPVQTRLDALTALGAGVGAAFAVRMPAATAGPTWIRAGGGTALGVAAGWAAHLLSGGRIDVLNWYGVPFL